MQIMFRLSKRASPGGGSLARIVVGAGIVMMAFVVAPVNIEAQAPAAAASQANARAHRYRATAPFVRDTASGQRRMPTEEEVAQAVQSLSTLAQRPENPPELRTGTGAVALDLQDGYNGVVLGRVNEDGSIETRCVFTFEEGVGFLGLVPVIE